MQTIALMIAHRDRERHPAGEKTKEGQYHGGNLVIVPVIAMVQACDLAPSSCDGSAMLGTWWRSHLCYAHHPAR